MDLSDVLELPSPTVQTIRLQIEELYTKLTAEQWQLLKSETPDNMTRFLLAELLLSMTQSVSSDLFRAHGHNDRPFTAESVRSSLGDALRQSLAPGSSMKSVILDQLTEFVAEEITDRVNCRRSERSASGRTTGQGNQISANKLEKMVHCVCKVLKSSAVDIEGLFKPIPRRQRTFEFPKGKSASSLTDSSSRSSSSDRRTSSESTGRSSDCRTSEDVQEIIGKEVSDIIQPLVDELSESDLSGLISQSSLESKAAADDIYQMISNEESHKSADPRRGSKSSKIWKGVGKKIKKLLAKLFATASLLKIGTRVRKKFSKETQVHSRESVKSLMDSVESLLLSETKDRVSPANASVLSNVLYRFITTDVSVASPDQETKVPKSHKKIQADIQERVVNFLPLMNWWFSKEAGDYTNRATSALMEIESMVSRVSEVDAAKQREEFLKKTFVRLIMDQLVTRVCAKAKVTSFLAEPTDIIQNLCDKTWAEVKDVEFDMSPTRISVLHKAVYKDLLKMWACPELMLLAIHQKDPEVEQIIASSMIRHLTKRNWFFW